MTGKHELCFLFILISYFFGNCICCTYLFSAYFPFVYVYFFMLLASSEKRLLDLFASPSLSSSSSSSASYVSSYSSPLTSSDNDHIGEINNNHNEPFILRLGTGCHPKHLSNCSYLGAQQLPELWHSTLIGLNKLFSSVRNCKYILKIYEYPSRQSVYLL